MSEKQTTEEMLRECLVSVARGIENFIEDEYDENNEDGLSPAAAWVEELLDVEASVPMNNPSMPSSFEVMVTCGGPNVWVTFYRNGNVVVEGAWAFTRDKFEMSGKDPLDVFGYLEGVWDAVR